MLKGAVLRYLVSDALSLTGNSIAGVVLPLVLLARTGDALAAGSLALICAIPQFICGILGGALLDRANRKVVCVASDLISAASVALLPIVDGIWGLSFGWFVALGLLGAVGSLAYTALSGRLSRRAWFVISLLGMGVGAVGMGLLPDTPLLLASAAMLRLFAGPMSALPGFFAFNCVSQERRGSALGTLNALYLIIGPMGTFLGSALISSIQIDATGLVLAGLWIAVTVIALVAPALRDLGDHPSSAGVQAEQEGAV